MVIAVIVPFLNEERFLGNLLDSISRQSRAPDRLLLVDDGSTDTSPEIAKGFAARHAYATVLQRPPRGPEPDRLEAAAEWRCFQWAVSQLEGRYDVVAKLDADLGLTPGVFAELEARFLTDPQLGMAGAHLSEAKPNGAVARMRSRPEHVHGATKFYRGGCYEQIASMPAVHGWDMLDEVKARSLGWRTASFAMPGGDPLHLRPMGTYDGAARGFRRWGQGDYIGGAHPLIVLLVGLHRLRDRPRVLGTVNYYLGWVLAATRRMPRAEPEVRAFGRREQLRRIRRRVLSYASR